MDVRPGAVGWGRIGCARWSAMWRLLSLVSIQKRPRRTNSSGRPHAIYQSVRRLATPRHAKFFPVIGRVSLPIRHALRLAAAARLLIEGQNTWREDLSSHLL